MGFLERAIRRGISEGLGNAIGKVVEEKLAPQAAEFSDMAARQLDQAVQGVRGEKEESKGSSLFGNLGGLESAFSSLEKAAQGYATEMGRDIKICPSCGQPAKAEAKFCPSCSAALPEQTLAEAAVCTECGTQNNLGTTYCQACGAMLPAAIQEQQAAEARNAAVMEQWDEQLPAYPKWDCGGRDYCIESYDYDAFIFTATFESEYEARNAVRRYRELVKGYGFKPAGQYPSDEHLYKMVQGTCYHIGTEHCFEGDQESPSIEFTIGEPQGGFDYVKPEDRKPKSFRDLLGF